MGTFDRFQAIPSMDILIMLHSFLRDNLRAIKLKRQKNPFNKQFSNKRSIRYHK